MIGLNVLLWVFVVIFAVIGYARGLKRELLVTSAVILALYVITILESFVPIIRDTAAKSVGGTILWMRIFIVGFLVFFGYQVPNIPRVAANNRFKVESQQDAILGLIMGAVNGFLLFGTVWYYMDKAGYPFSMITRPDVASEAGKAASALIKILAPHWLTTPVIYFVVAVALAFILIVFV